MGYIPAILANGDLAFGVSAAVIRETLGLSDQQAHRMSALQLYDSDNVGYGEVELYAGEYSFRQHEGDLANVNVSVLKAAEVSLPSTEFFMGGKFDLSPYRSVRWVASHLGSTFAIDSCGLELQTPSQAKVYFANVSTTGGAPTIENDLANGLTVRGDKV